jgi:hypothetical protein
MYNHNYGGLTTLRQAQGPRPNPLGIAKVSAKPKINTY